VSNPSKPPRRRTYLGNGCEFGGADSSAFGSLAASDTMAPSPSDGGRQNLPELKKKIPVGYRYPTGLKGIN
jgi:hypothetical protein